MRGLTRPRLACWLFLSVIGAASAQADDLRFERLGTEAGLSHNTVNPVLQDRRGFLWFGTADGLNRYDGREFVIWRHDPQDPESLSSSEVWTLLEDRAGNLWVGTANGLNRFDRSRGRFVRYPLRGVPQAGRPEAVWTLYEDVTGTVWAGLSGGLFRWDSEADRFAAFLHAPGDSASLAPGAVLGIQESPDGELWVLTGLWERIPATLNRLDRGSRGFTRFRAPDDWLRTGGFLVDRSGDFWINVSGLGTFDPQSGRFQRPLLQHGYPATTARIHQDSDGYLWIPTLQGFLRVDAGSPRVTGRYPSPGGEDQLSGFATWFLEDRAGTIWLGTRGGLYRWDRRRKPFVHWQRSSGDPRSLSSDRVSAVLEDMGGRIWVGTYGSGLNRLDGSGDGFVRYRHDPVDPSSLCHDSIWHIAESSSGRIWLGVNDGLCGYDPVSGRFSRHPVDLPAAEGHESRVTYIVEDAKGRLWLGSHFGLVRYEPQSGRSVRFPSTGDRHGPSSDTVHSLYFEGENTLWLGTGGEDLDKLDLETGLFTHYPLATESGGVLHSEGIFEIHRDRAGLLWLATADGLSRFDPKAESFKHFFTRDGLPSSVVYSILEDDLGRLWLGTGRGLSRFHREAPPEKQFRNFDLSDGIGNLEFNRHAAWRTSDGRLLLGGMKGLTIFRPVEIRDNDFVPPVALTRIQIWRPEGAEEIDPFGLDQLALTHRESSFSFDFAALSYTSPEKNRYAYRLEGLDDGWVDAGTHGSARYTRVPPGKYVLRVRGSNNDGLWNDIGLSLPLTVTPPYWQTWWFRLAVLLLIVGALTALYRYRVARILELERLRLRIAGDLHDDLSSDLSGIALAAAMVERQDYLREPDRVRLAEVERTAEGILEGLRDIVWYINPEHDTLGAMVRRMRAAASRLLAGIDYSFDSTVAERDGEISMALRRNIFLIFKEALHNIARHSGAKRVSIGFEQRAQLVLLEVTDDGVGFDPASVERGFGLDNMRRRAEQMEATLRIDSGPGQGTTSRLEVNMARTRGGNRA